MKSGSLKQRLRAGRRDPLARPLEERRSRKERHEEAALRADEGVLDDVGHRGDGVERRRIRRQSTSSSTIAREQRRDVPVRVLRRVARAEHGDRREQQPGQEHGALDTEAVPPGGPKEHAHTDGQEHGEERVVRVLEAAEMRDVEEGRRSRSSR